ncbi:polyprenyl glycosylphosphotransferase [Pseudothermotoga hypogea DSM 11164 = NBRC 106472]|uniref:Polyprenyl glycosylphosphotransferase n=1 Tax=Pseudothermotoga hypogea DSM 11164 = NBRC 106472 TaxID=1123384 RepID=A0A0X1KSV1_9THEM|nr:sugar transferase [Pseudothermotoga hypogea]AJC74265.1 polyprenyl glycosylphosphotransferase [Pseudothermotoga hypogea DSM 11164 = NBRC 106472]
MFLVFLNFVSLFLLYKLFESTVYSIVFSLLAILFLYTFRAYDLENLESYTEQLIRTLLSTATSFVPILIFNALIDDHVPKHAFLLNLMINTLVLPILNVSFYRLTRKDKPITYLVVGKREDFEGFLQVIEKETNHRYIFAEYVNPSVDLLSQKAKYYDAVLVADQRLSDVVKKASLKNIEYLPTFVEKVLQRIPVEIVQRYREFYELSLQTVKTRSPAKRVIDVVVSIVALVLTSPIMLIIALCILIEDGRPIIFKQRRIGKDGKPFTVYKFRTMRNSQTSQAKYATHEQDRILKIGHIIRPYRLDELPQFINVLKGDMSVVGPRPEWIDLANEYSQKIPYYDFRHIVKPGITGWAQIKYKYSSSVEEAKEKLSYDLYYVKNRTIFLDLKIMLHTLEAIIFRRGAK